MHWMHLGLWIWSRCYVYIIVVNKAQISWCLGGTSLDEGTSAYIALKYIHVTAAAHIHVRQCNNTANLNFCVLKQTSHRTSAFYGLHIHTWWLHYHNEQWHCSKCWLAEFSVSTVYSENLVYEVFDGIYMVEKFGIQLFCVFILVLFDFRQWNKENDQCLLHRRTFVFHFHHHMLLKITCEQYARQTFASVSCINLKLTA